MSLHEYSFMSRWVVRAPIKTVGTVLLRHEDWSSWWHGLETVEVTHTSNPIGAEFACTWRSHLGYRLRLVLTVTEYIPNHYIAFTSHGDLVGKGSFDLESHGNDTHITILWRVVTTKKWMNLATPLLRPIFVYNHHLLMKQGEAGINAYLADLTTQQG
jgi:hypothetical protein